MQDEYRYIIMPMRIDFLDNVQQCQKHHNLAKWPAYGVLLRRGIPDGSC